MKKLIIAACLLSTVSFSVVAINPAAPFVPAYTTEKGVNVSVRADLDIKNYDGGSVEILLYTQIDNPEKPYITWKLNHFHYVLDPHGTGKPIAVLYQVDRVTNFSRNFEYVMSGSIQPTPIVPIVEGSNEYKTAIYAYNFAVQSGKMAEAQAKYNKGKK